MSARVKKVEAPEPNDAEKAQMGEPVTRPETTPDYVAPDVTGPGNPAAPMFADLGARNCYERAAMSLLVAEVHAKEDPYQHRENASAWCVLGNTLRAVGL